MIRIEKWKADQDGPLTEAAMRDGLENRGFFVSRYVYPPGTYFPDHTHDIDKIDEVLSGRFRVDALAESVILEAGDSVTIPNGTVHSAEVFGDEPVINLDATLG